MLIKNLFCIFCILVLVGQKPAVAQVKAKSQKQSLKVLSWNIAMLPSIATLSKRVGKRHNKARAKEISLQLKQSNYDILVLQEAFHMGARKTIKRKLKETYPYQYGPANYRLLSTLTNSGVIILSQIPLKHLGEIDYSQSSGIDRWSRKGALMVEGDWQGHPFQIIGTHLQAGGTKATKLSQCTEIFEQFLQPHKADQTPQLLCGDMNIAKQKPALYNSMIDILELQPYKLQGTQQTTNFQHTSEIDYIHIRPNGTQLKEVIRKVVLYPAPEGSKYPWLSDHDAVEAIISF